jgi:hypothetical protein
VLVQTEKKKGNLRSSCLILELCLATAHQFSVSRPVQAILFELGNLAAGDGALGTPLSTFQATQWLRDCQPRDVWLGKQLVVRHDAQRNCRRRHASCNILEALLPRTLTRLPKARRGGRRGHSRFKMGSCLIFGMFSTKEATSRMLLGTRLLPVLMASDIPANACLAAPRKRSRKPCESSE